MDHCLQIFLDYTTPQQPALAVSWEQFLMYSDAVKIYVCIYTRQFKSVYCIYAINPVLSCVVGCKFMNLIITRPRLRQAEPGKLAQYLGHNLISRLQINLVYSQVFLIFNKLHTLQRMSETDQKLF